MSTRELAHGLAGLGRNGDSVLVHMQPEEVSGLQSLARANGTSLTINPDTGMPEAFNLGRALGSLAKIALPIAAGFALGPGGLFGVKGLFGSALGTGLAVGAGAYALTGDPAYALSSTLGGAGGFGLGSNLGAYGSAIKEVPKVALSAADDVIAPALPGASSIPGATGANAFTNVGSSIAKAAPIPSTPAPGMFENQIAGIKGIFGSRPEGTMNYANFLEKGYPSPVTGEMVKPSLWQDVATVGAPVLGAMSQGQRPGIQGIPEEEPLNYKGPYKPSPREYRMPTLEELQRMRAEGSPEFMYFNQSNPSPGFERFATGGEINTQETFISPDSTPTAPLSEDGYGIGRLNTMATEADKSRGASYQFAEGGIIPEVAGMGQVPQMGQMPQMGQLPPMGQVPPQDISGINTLLSQAIRDPLGRGMAKGGYLDGAGDGMSDSIPATIEGKQPARLADGEFVIPADVVSHLGNGSTKAGAKVLYKMMNKVRKARTGNPKQGKQINPGKFVPV